MKYISLHLSLLLLFFGSSLVQAQENGVKKVKATESSYQISQDQLKLICPELTETVGVENLESGCRLMSLISAKHSSIEKGIVKKLILKEDGEQKQVNIYQYENGKLVKEGEKKLRKSYTYDELGNHIDDNKVYENGRLVKKKEQSGVIEYIYNENCVKENVGIFRNEYCFNENGKAIQWNMEYVPDEGSSSLTKSTYNWKDDVLVSKYSEIWRDSKMIDAPTSFYSYRDDGLLSKIEIGASRLNIVETYYYEYEIMNAHPLRIKKSTFRTTILAPERHLEQENYYEFDEFGYLVKHTSKTSKEHTFIYVYELD